MNSTITEYIAQFKSTKNVSYLAKAIVLTISQRRTTELAYGGYCKILSVPSKVRAGEFKINVDDIFSFNKFHYSRSDLIETFGDKFPVNRLPEDFKVARQQGIAFDNNKLVIGEYAENSARIAYITHGDCIINDYYNSVSGVRHIHSIINVDADKIFVSTGDTRKVLDLWATPLRFKKRIKKHFAGYTAALMLNGAYYFGTDFSTRPNYIEMLNGKKFFFPQKAYNLAAIAFCALQDRYIVSVNSDMPEFGGRKTLSVFDTVRAEFTFCEYLDDVLT